jgi:membrane-bound lytic murein transglycosylase D
MRGPAATSLPDRGAAALVVRLACCAVTLALAACTIPRSAPSADAGAPGETAAVVSVATDGAATDFDTTVKTAESVTTAESMESTAAGGESLESTHAAATTAHTAADVIHAFEAADEEFEDLLEHLRRGYAFPAVDNDAVRRHADWYARHPDYLERVLNRARPYLPHVAAEIAARGLPAELAFIPVIESAFDPFAYSHGRAAGLWQIVPGTGRRFGLKQNWWYDGRRDVVESTRAALDYFEYLHAFFDGDWLLAVAAYNSGEGTVRRAIRNNQAAGRPTDFWSLRLPNETRGYVPRLLGLAAVMADPEVHALSLPPLHHAPVFTVVELDGQIDLAIAAELAGIELAELQALNPAFNRWATDPDGPHRLLLPVDSEPSFLAALAELPPSERVRWHRHKVAAGDTLGGIARQYRTTVRVLQSVNGISGTNIRLGSHLMVPTSTRSLEDYPLSADNRLASTQQRERSGRVRSEHTVRSGESLWTIARRHGVGVRELAAWNGMAPGDTLAVGRKLVVWQHGGSAAAARAPAADAKLRRVNYTVRRGDSLYRIASNFRVSVADIKRWNKLDGQRYLQPGQRLVLHVDVTAQSGG